MIVSYVYFVYKLNKLNVNIFDHAERDVFAVFAHLICFQQHRKNRGIVVVNEQILTQTPLPVADANQDGRRSSVIMSRC